MSDVKDWLIPVVGIFLLLGLVWVADEFVFRYTRAKVERANIRLALQQAREELDADYHRVDQIHVINSDTDVVVFQGNPEEVYEWLLQAPLAGLFDVHNKTTGRIESSSKFIGKYVR